MSFTLCSWMGLVAATVALAPNEATPSEPEVPATSGPTPAKSEPIPITLVAPPAVASALAAELEPRLVELGRTGVHRRCDDFSCVVSPRPDDGPRVVAVVEGSRALVIVTQGSTTTMEDLELADPPGPVDLEALVFAITRALVSPPARLSTDWAAAEGQGRWLAPTPAPEPEPEPSLAAEPEPVPAPTSAFVRGPFVTLGLGTTTTTGGAFSLGMAARADGGFLFATRSRLRVAVGARATHLGSFDRDSSGMLAGEARLTLGLGLRHVMPSLRLGLGPALTYGSYWGEPTLTGIGSAGFGFDGMVGEHLGVGLELGTMVDVVEGHPYPYATIGATWSWDVPRRRSGRHSAR